MTKLRSCLLKVIIAVFLMCFPMAVFAGSGADWNAKNAQCKLYDKNEDQCKKLGVNGHNIRTIKLVK